MMRAKDRTFHCSKSRIKSGAEHVNTPPQHPNPELKGYPPIFSSIGLLKNLVEVIPGYENFILINLHWISSIGIRLTRPWDFARCGSDTKAICPTAIIKRTEFSFNCVRPTSIFLNDFQNSSRAP